jgi:hypothetical protein
MTFFGFFFVKVMLVSENDLGDVSSSSISQKTLFRIGIISFLNVW